MNALFPPLFKLELLTQTLGAITQLLKKILMYVKYVLTWILSYVFKIFFL